MTINPVILYYFPLLCVISLKLCNAAYDILYLCEVKLSINFLNHPFFCNTYFIY